MICYHVCSTCVLLTGPGALQKVASEGSWGGEGMTLGLGGITNTVIRIESDASRLCVRARAVCKIDDVITSVFLESTVPRILSIHK